MEIAREECFIFSSKKIIFCEGLRAFLSLLVTSRVNNFKTNHFSGLGSDCNEFLTTFHVLGLQFSFFSLYQNMNCRFHSDVYFKGFEISYINNLKRTAV